MSTNLPNNSKKDEIIFDAKPYDGELDEERDPNSSRALLVMETGLNEVPIKSDDTRHVYHKIYPEEIV